MTNPGPAPRPTVYDVASILSGAPAVGRAGSDLIAWIEDRLPRGILRGTEPFAWLRDDVLVFIRGEACVLPLLWEPEPQQPSEHPLASLWDEFGQLWRSIQSACEYRHGNQLTVDLPAADRPEGLFEPPRPYGIALAAAGAKQAQWWAFGNTALVQVIGPGAVPGARSLAIHLIPVGWVSVVRPGGGAAAADPQLDLSWTWDDVVRAHARRDAVSPGPG